jgi:predicted permease
VLSHALWQSAFAGDGQAVGRTLEVDGQPLEIVGVMPQNFVFLDPDVMFWRPLPLAPAQRSDASRHNNSFRHIGRLKPGATIERAREEIDALNARNLERFPQYKQMVIDSGFRTIVVRVQDDLVGEVKSGLYLLWGAAVFVLLIGCANIGGLVLARSRARFKELATCMALGADRWRLARQSIVECSLLTVASGVLGVWLGSMILPLLARTTILDLPRQHEIRVDSTVVVLSLAVTAAVGIVLGLIPIAGAGAVPLSEMLREAGRGGTSGRRSRGFRRGLVVVQTCVTFTLLVGTGLLLISFIRARAVDPGFDSRGVLTASISVPRVRYPTLTALQQLLDELNRQTRTLPGTLAAGATNWVPFSDTLSNSLMFAEGVPVKPGQPYVSPRIVSVTPGYFEAMGVELIAGRFIDDRDTAGPPVLVVDDRLARRFWPDQDPVGRRMYRPSDPKNIAAITANTVFLTVVGVVRELKLGRLTEGDRDNLIGACFFPMARMLPAQPYTRGQNPTFGVTFAIRTGGDPLLQATPFRRVASAVDPEIAVFDLKTMSERTAASLTLQRTPMLISLAFGAIALLLSALGLYGVLAYLVSDRRKEIGIRLALGSSRARIIDLVLREALWLLVAGFGLGLAATSMLFKTIDTILFGVTATNPIVLMAAAGALTLVALSACLIPARRATRVDPLVALS